MASVPALIDTPALGTTPVIQIVSSLDQPFLGSLLLLDANGGTFGRVLRELRGPGVPLMSFSIQTPDGTPLLRIWRPRPTKLLSVGGGFMLSDSTDQPLGRLSFSWNSAVLETTSGRQFRARVPGWTWKGFPILAGGIELAKCEYPNWAFPTPRRPGGLSLKFSTLATDPADRFYLLALAILISLLRPVKSWPR